MVPTHHRMLRPPGHSCAPCSRPCRDLAGVQPSCFSPRGESRRDRGKARAEGRGVGGEEERGDLEGPIAEGGSLLRFGRNTQGSWSNKRLSPRAGEGLSSPFWSLAAPQRFGKK